MTRFTKYDNKVNAQLIIPAEKELVNEIKSSCPMWMSTMLSILIVTKTVTNVHKNFKGSAICDSRDAYDEMVGKDVAELKCWWKYHTSMYKKYDQIIKKLEETIKVLETLYNMHEEKAINIEHDYDAFYLNK